MKISAVISAYNAQDTIKQTLESLKWVDEIIFVDNSSTDKTVEIAKKFTKKIFTRPNNQMLNVNKNFGFTKATGDWILCLDSDEEVSKELKDEVQTVLKSSTVDGYNIPRKNIIFGKWIQNSIWWPDYQLRLFRRGKGKYAEEHVHEKIAVQGEIGKLENPIIHQNYTSVSQWIHKMDTIYTDNEAKQFIKSGKEITWVDAIRFPANDFLKTFFAEKGYKDGLHGLVLSLLQAFYSEIVFAKIWEKQGFKEFNDPSFLKNVVGEIRKMRKEVKYWILTAIIAETKNPFKKLVLKYKRRKTRI